MKLVAIINSLIVCTIFSFLTSCDDSVYYKTFDYKTMSFIQPTEKQDNCVRFISKSETKIELEVIRYYSSIKRTYVKKDNYWYSKVKYELLGDPKMGLVYGGVHEIEYFIFSNHVIKKDETYIHYIDLTRQRDYYSSSDNFLNFKNFQYFELKDLKKYDYNVDDYYVYFDVLNVRKRDYVNGIVKSDFVEQKLGEPVLDIFYWIDREDIYTPSTDCKFIYDEN